MSCFSPGILYRTMGSEETLYVFLSEGYCASRLQKTFCFVPFQGSWAGQLSLSFVRTGKCPQNSLSIHARATGPPTPFQLLNFKTLLGSQDASGASCFETTISNLNVQLPHKEFWLLLSVPCQVPFDTSMYSGSQAWSSRKFGKHSLVRVCYYVCVHLHCICHIYIIYVCVLVKMVDLAKNYLDQPSCMHLNMCDDLRTFVGLWVCSLCMDLYVCIFVFMFVPACLPQFA